jgi:phospholipase/carboxylesterase
MRSVMNSDLCLQYLELSSEDGRSNAPICIFLHGRLANEADLFDLGPSIHQKYRVLSVRAPIRMGLKAYGWFYSERSPVYRAKDTEEANNSLKLLQEFIIQVKDKYRVNTKEIFLLGFSQGAILSLGVAFTRPDLIGGIVCLSGCILPSFLSQITAPDQLKHFPIFLSHGTEDDILPIEFGRSAKATLDQLPVDLVYEEHKMGHNVTDTNFSSARDWLLKQ